MTLPSNAQKKFLLVQYEAMWLPNCYHLLYNVIQKRYIISFLNIQARITSLTFLGFMFLVYPLLGHLADVYLTRYRTLKSAYMIIIIGGSALFAYVTIDLTADLVWNFVQFHHKQTSAIPLLLFAVYMYVVGLGLFQANAIQFGLDQLLELISFTPRYYWCQNMAGLVLFYTASACMAINTP